MELALAFPSTEITVVDVVTRQRILHAAGGRTPLQGLKWAFGSAAEDARGFRIGRGKMTVAGDVLLPPLGTENPRGQLIYVNKRPARAGKPTQRDELSSCSMNYLRLGREIRVSAAQKRWRVQSKNFFVRLWTSWPKGTWQAGSSRHTMPVALPTSSKSPVTPRGERKEHIAVRITPAEGIICLTGASRDFSGGRVHH